MRNKQLMSKILTYCSFVFVSLVVIIAFVTATTYIQLAVAIILYLPLIYFSFKVFPRKTRTYLLKKSEKAGTETAKIENITIADIDKRAFLKLIGATGLFFFIVSVFGRRAESLLFGQNIAQVPGGDPTLGKIGATPASPIEEYSISGIDYEPDGFFGYIKKDGSWYIMKQDPDTGLFFYIRGESKFPQNWENRKKLKYDYFNNVFKS